MKKALLSLVFLALAVTWVIEKSSATRLTIEVAARSEQQKELSSLQHERERLRALQPSAEELASLRLADDEHARLQAELARQETARAAGPAALPVGEWTPAREWKNRGKGTPRASVETALWAAVGGDTAALKNLLSLDDSTRAKAAALIARMPESSRALYASPEDLLAAFTIKNIPDGEAQLVWFNQTGEDDATACVFLQRGPQEGERPDPVVLRSEPARAQTREEAVREALQRQAQRAASRDREPPRAPETGNSSSTYLSLHRDDAGWRLVVPPSAVEKIARELAAPPGS